MWLCCSDIVVSVHLWKNGLRFSCIRLDLYSSFVGHEGCVSCLLNGYLPFIIWLCRQRPLLSLILLTVLVPMCLIRLCTRLFCDWMVFIKLGFCNVSIPIICIVMTETQRKMTLLVVWLDKFLWIYPYILPLNWISISCCFSL